MGDVSGRGHIRSSVAVIAWNFSDKTRNISDMIVGSRTSIRFQDPPNV
jgi:ribosomal protein L18E